MKVTDLLEKKNSSPMPIRSNRLLATKVWCIVGRVGKLGRKAKWGHLWRRDGNVERERIADSNSSRTTTWAQANEGGKPKNWGQPQANSTLTAGVMGAKDRVLEIEEDVRETGTVLSTQTK